MLMFLSDPHWTLFLVFMLFKCKMAPLSGIKGNKENIKGKLSDFKGAICKNC